ncbi:MAG: hypothetical protein Sapg2KO_41210 [Saprospiraceae bacterium]
MKVVATNEFNNKLKNISDMDFQNKLLSFVDLLSETNNFQDIKNKFELSLNNVLVHKIDEYRIFFSVEEIDNTETILLIDLIIREKSTPRASFKNPKYNSSINPKYNSSINPKYNSSINPKYNSSINPKYNSSINPKYNSSINPKYNSSVNPKYNSSINPKYNSSINPKYNSSIDPKLNPSFNGFYIYDLDNNIKGFAIKSPNDTLTIYDNENNYSAYAVKFNKGYAVFKAESTEQNSFFISDNANGYNEFSINGEWIGHLK